MVDNTKIELVRRESKIERLLRGVILRLEERFIPSIRRAGASKRVTGSGLPMKAYRSLYRTVQRASGDVFVEIGAGSGTSTVVIAQALVSKGGASTLISAEKFEGGHYSDFGERDDNITRFHQLLDRFQVRDRVTVFPHYVTEETVGDLRNLVGDQRLMGIFIDADGRIDRLLPSIWGLLPKDAPIVFDDYSNDIKWFRPVSNRYPQGGSKHLRCYRMVHTLEKLGLIRIDEIVYGTVFTTKISDRDMGEDDLESLGNTNKSVDKVYAQWENDL